MATRSELRDELFDFPARERPPATPATPEEAALCETIGEEERARFARLFGELPEAELPERVLAEMASGASLSAAYALYLAEERAAGERAEAINRRNEAMSSGSMAESAGELYYSPNEVRAMSRREVHEKYARILESMKHWN